MILVKINGEGLKLPPHTSTRSGFAARKRQFSRNKLNALDNRVCGELLESCECDPLNAGCHGNIGFQYFLLAGRVPC